MEQVADIAMVGLGVMGQSLALNFSDRGYTVVTYNRFGVTVDEFLQGKAKGHKNVFGAHSIEEMAALLKRPRKIMLMVMAGAPIDELIELMTPHLEPGDLIIDGGNSHFDDTSRREASLAKQGILYIGAGISGGEEGARHGPSIMPSGSAAAWPLVKDMFHAICAKTPSGSPCCDWIGDGGAGHFVKMVHNGIEYGDMQLICEAYQLMRQGLGLSNAEMQKIFADWNEGELNSYLIEITRDILGYRDENGEYVVDHILDAAGQKGTGKWTVTGALDLGTPVTLIGEAVFARCLSAMKAERVKAAKILAGPDSRIATDKKSFVDDLRQALLASKIVSYAQGFMLMREAAQANKWNINYGGIALVWRGGCIIRSAFLDDIKAAYDRNPHIENLLLDTHFRSIVEKSQSAWRRVVAAATLAGIPTPAIGAALTFYDGYRTADSPANLLQAQRDYFGAHTYERTDQARGAFFHTEWTKPQTPATPIKKAI